MKIEGDLPGCKWQVYVGADRQEWALPREGEGTHLLHVWQDSGLDVSLSTSPVMLTSGFVI